MTPAPPPYRNPYCPPWMAFSPVLKGIRDYEFDLDLPPVAVPAGGAVRGLQLPIDNDSDYLVREIQFVIVAAEEVTPPAPADLRVRIRDGDGRLFTTDFVPILDLTGPLAPPWPLRRGCVLIIDYQNLGGGGEGSATVWMIVKGWKRIECPGDPLEIALDYKPMYQRVYDNWAGQDLEDFEYPFRFDSDGVEDRFKLPLQTDNDADFVWWGITGDWNTANNDVAVVNNVGLTFYDVEGLKLVQAPLLNKWSSPNCGLFRESVLASGGGRPAPFYPEIFIPRGGVVQLDISFGAAATVRFSLRGFKVYGRCR
jgi:hypothetical protein